MVQDLVLRIVAALLLIAALGSSFAHRRRAEREGGRLRGPRESPAVLLMRAMFVLSLLFAVGVHIVDPDGVPWGRLHLPLWIRWPAAGVAVAAVALLRWTFETLGLNVSATASTREGHVLVRNGPYAIIRHPLYVSAVVLFVSLGLLLESGLLILLAALGLSYVTLRLKEEEAHLAEAFGSEYGDYARRTGRFVPRLRGPAD